MIRKFDQQVAYTYLLDSDSRYVRGTMEYSGMNTIERKLQIDQYKILYHEVFIARRPYLIKQALYCSGYGFVGSLITFFIQRAYFQSRAMGYGVSALIFASVLAQGIVRQGNMIERKVHECVKTICARYERARDELAFVVPDVLGPICRGEDYDERLAAIKTICNAWPIKGLPQYDNIMQAHNTLTGLMNDNVDKLNEVYHQLNFMTYIAYARKVCLMSLYTRLGLSRESYELQDIRGDLQNKLQKVRLANLNDVRYLVLNDNEQLRILCSALSNSTFKSDAVALNTENLPYLGAGLMHAFMHQADNGSMIQKMIRGRHIESEDLKKYCDEIINGDNERALL